MRNYIALTTAAFALVFLATTVPAHAQSQGLPLQVAPARQEIAVDPGQTSAVTIRFFNLAEFPTSGYIRAADFVVSDAEGTPRIIEDSSQASPRFSAASWVTLPFDRMSIAPNDKVSVQAVIQVPSDARPGGRYLAVYFEPATSLPTAVGTRQDAGSAVSQRIAALVYIRVNGPITEKALVSRIFGPSFLEYGPITFEADVLNKGDYHITPQGSMSIRNMFGGLVDQKKLDAKNIFPDSIRSYEGELGKKWMMGKYTVELSAAYGTTGQIITRSIDVWVFPWKLALIVLLAILILVVFTKKTYTRLVIREKGLESEIRKEHEEIQKLKEQLEKK